MPRGGDLGKAIRSVGNRGLRSDPMPPSRTHGLSLGSYCAPLCAPEDQNMTVRHKVIHLPKKCSFRDIMHRYASGDVLNS